MFPKPHYRITSGVELLIYVSAALYISFNLRNPKTRICFYGGFPFIPFLAMPKITINEYGQSIFINHDIWFAVNFLRMDPKPQISYPKRFPKF